MRIHYNLIKNKYSIWMDSTDKFAHETIAAFVSVCQKLTDCAFFLENCSFLFFCL